MGNKNQNGENDISSILNQLKMAYSVADEDYADDVLNSEPVYEDSELSSLLSKIISENNDDSDEEENDFSECIIDDHIIDDNAEGCECDDSDMSEEDDGILMFDDEENDEEQPSIISEELCKYDNASQNDSILGEDEALPEHIDVPSNQIDDEFALFENIKNADMSDEEALDVDDACKDVAKSTDDSSTSKTIEEKPYIVLSSDEYTDDPLQWHLNVSDGVCTQEIPEKTADGSVPKNEEIQDDDISLLLQLGYKKELKSKIGSERTDSVIQNITNSYRPDKDKIPFGFCGKEFSSKDQIESIKRKYDYDKRNLIVKIAILLSIAFVLLLLNIVFKGREDTNYLIMFPFMELIVMLLGCFIIRRELLSGTIGIFKFSPNIFALPLLSLLVFVAYDAFLIVSCFVDSLAVDIAIAPLFGFETALLFVFALLSQLMNCVREQKTFNLISSEKQLYAGEIFVSKEKDVVTRDERSIHTHEIRKQIKGNAVIIKKTKYVAEYFKRSAESFYNSPYSAWSLILALFSSVVITCVLIAKSTNISDIVTSIAFSIYICISASFVLSFPFVTYVISKRLNEKGCAFVGIGAIKEYEKTNSVIFPDTVAFELNDSIEMISLGDNDVNTSIKTANRLFASLGGTLYKSVTDNSICSDEPVGIANIDIALTNDNGIELYMDNETHILLGNRKFILSYRKRVDFSVEDFIPDTKYKDKDILYVVIDGKLSLAYIVSTQLKESFKDVVKLLTQNSIKTMVSTYEPNVKPTRTQEGKIGVYRQYEYESSTKSVSRFGGIVSSEDATNIAYALVALKDIRKITKKSSQLSLGIILIGFVMAIAVSLIGYLLPIMRPILKYRDIIAVLFQILGVAVIAINTIRILKNNK